MNVGLDRTHESDDLRIAFYVFIFVFGVYAFFFGGTGANPHSTFALTRAIVEDGTLWIEKYAQETVDVSFANGHVFTNKAPGVALLAAIPYTFLYRLERLVGIDTSVPMIVARNMYFCTVVICGSLGALIAAGLYLYGRLRVQTTAVYSVLVSVLVALGTPLFPYSTVLHIHVPNSAFLLLAFLAVSSRSSWGFGLSGFLGGMAALTNYLCIPVVGIVVVLLLSRTKAVKPVIWYVIGGLIPFGIFVWYQLSTMGELLKNPVGTNPEFLTSGALGGVFVRPSLDAIVGVTISRYRGLFFLSPVLLLALVGSGEMLRRGKRLFDLSFIASMCIFFFAAVVSFNGWAGGDAIGPRYLLPIVPLLGLLFFEARSVPRFGWVLLGTYSVLANFSAAAVNPQPYAWIKDPLGEHIIPVLITGRHDQAQMPGLASGHTSVFLDSFNLGEAIFGSGSILSLGPVLLWMLLGATALLKAAQRIDARNIASRWS